MNTWNFDSVFIIQDLGSEDQNVLEELAVVT